MTHDPLPTGPFCDWPKAEKKRLYGLIIDGVPIELEGVDDIWTLIKTVPQPISRRGFRLALTKDTLSPALKEVLKGYNWSARDMDGRTRFYVGSPTLDYGSVIWTPRTGEYINLGSLHGYTVGTIPWDQSLQRIHDEPE